MSDAILEPDTARAKVLATEIAHHAMRCAQLISHAEVPMGEGQAETLINTLHGEFLRIGFVADLLSAAMRNPSGRVLGDAEQWLLSPAAGGKWHE